MKDVTLHKDPRFKALFDFATVGIFLVDQKGKIIKANPFAQNLFGYTRDEILHLSIEDLLPERFRKGHVGKRSGYHAKPRQRAMGGDQELFASRKDGTEFPVEISLSHFSEEGENFVISFVNDITERRHAEKELKSLNSELETQVVNRTRELGNALMELQQTNSNLQKMIGKTQQAELEAKRSLEKEKELNELKSRFVSMASHEFRTPLTAVLSSITLLAKYTKEDQQEKRDKHIDRIRNSVKNLNIILNDFLSLEKLQEGKVRIEAERFNLADLILEVEEEMQDLLKTGQVLQCNCNNSVEVNLDKHLLRNILINLVSNAIKYSPEQKEIWVLITAAQDRIFIAVKDQGIGIPETEQRHMFNRFFRANNVTNIEGTGLGLTIVQRYLNLMQGTISFESEEGKGSTFTIDLPKEIHDEENITH